MRLDGVKKVSHPTNAGALVTHDPFFGKFRLVLSERAEKLQSHLFVKGSLLYKELYRNGGKDLFTFSAVNLGRMAESKSRGLSVLSTAS